MKRKIGKSACILVLAAAVLAGYLFLRGPQVSNFLKEQISREFESQTGYELTADKLYANLFPFYVGAKNIKIFDGHGSLIFSSRGIKAYAGVAALLEKTILVKRLVLASPDIKVTDEHIDHLLRLAGKKPSGGFTLKMESVALRDGSVSYARQADGLAVSCRGLNADALLDRDEAGLSCREFAVSANGVPKITAKLDKARGSFRNGLLKLDELSIESKNGGSAARISGDYSSAGGARIKTKIGLLVATLKDVFHLKNPDNGKLLLAGEIRLPGGGSAAPGNAPEWKKTYMDMSVKGGFYIQTLMELLHANVDVTGFAKIDAHVKGPLDGLAGGGEGSLQKAVIYGASADDMEFGLNFQNGLLSFRKIKGRLYGGRAAGDFSINLPRVRALNMDLAFHDLNSRKFLTGFLKLDLPLPGGRLSGRMVNRSAGFAPAGNFQFRATSVGKDFPGRLRSVTSDFALAGSTVRFSNTIMKTGLTTAGAGGSINYKDSTIDMNVSLRSIDLTDLTLPYSTMFGGSGGFDGSVSGPIKNPTFAGRISIANATMSGLKAGEVAGTVSYNKDLLQISGLQAKLGAQSIHVAGRMLFPKAGKIFELGGPVYSLEVKLGQTPALRAARFIRPDFTGLSGTIVSADLKISGAAPEVSGKVDAANVAYSGFEASSARFGFDYKDGKLLVPDGVLMKDGAAVRLSGELAGGGEFNFSARSSGIDIKDLFPGKKLKMPVDYKISFTAGGRGTVENPRVSISGKLDGGKYEGRPVKGGEFKAAVSTGPQGRTVSLEASLQDERIVLKGHALLEGDLPWQADVELKNGRYDYLISPFVKNVPADLFIGLQGKGRFSGTKQTINGSLVLNQLALTAYGQSFSAVRPVSLDVRGKTLVLKSMDFSGAQTDLQMSGTVSLGSSYDVDIEGKSSLALLKGFLKQANLLTGNASYVFHVGGAWGKPDISGDLSLSNSVIGVAGMPVNLRIMSAYLYVDEDRIVLEKFSSKMGGGQLNASGVIYLSGLKPDKYYFDGVLKNADVSSRGIDAVLDGNFVIRGDPDSRELAGEVFIRRAAYRKNVDWRGLIFKKKAVRPLPNGFEATTGLSVRVYGSQNIMVANNIARAPLGVDLTIRGTLANPIPLGRVESSSGKVYFRNTEFSIEHASVIFSDPSRIDPALDIMASTTIKGYRLTINMAGTPSRLNLAFSSQPHLEEPDILSLLTTGNFGGGASAGIEGGVGASEASSFLTGQFQNVITKRLKSITGFERFDIEPYVSKTTGTVAPRVTVSKRLLGDKLFVIYSAPIGTEEQIIRMEYAVSPKVSLIGVRDDTGDIGGDVAFRFKFR